MTELAHQGGRLVTGLLIRWGRRVRRLVRAVAGYRALARQYETDLAMAEAAVGKLSAELVLQQREYAALEIRAKELIGRVAELEAALEADITSELVQAIRIADLEVPGRKGWSEN